MVEKELICTSCKIKITNLVGSTTFKCPDCGKIKIVRCAHCREVGTKYKCSSCNFEGPN